jgi:hypothetical protein
MKRCSEAKNFFLKKPKKTDVNVNELDIAPEVEVAYLFASLSKLRDVIAILQSADTVRIFFDPNEIVICEPALASTCYIFFSLPCTQQIRYKVETKQNVFVADCNAIKQSIHMLNEEAMVLMYMHKDKLVIEEVGNGEQSHKNELTAMTSILEEREECPELEYALTFPIQADVFLDKMPGSVADEVCFKINPSPKPKFIVEMTSVGLNSMGSFLLKTVENPMKFEAHFGKSTSKLIRDVLHFFKQEDVNVCLSNLGEPICIFGKINQSKLRVFVSCKIPESTLTE